MKTRYSTILCRIGFVYFIALLVLAVTPFARAQSGEGSTSVSGGGTLSWDWTVYDDYGRCGPDGEYFFDLTEFSSFSYVLDGTTYPLSGTAAYLTTQWPNDCPSGPEGNSWSVDGCTLSFTPESGGSGTASLNCGGGVSYSKAGETQGAAAVAGAAPAIGARARAAGPSPGNDRGGLYFGAFLS